MSSSETTPLVISDHCASKIACSVQKYIYAGFGCISSKICTHATGEKVLKVRWKQKTGKSGAGCGGQIFKQKLTNRRYTKTKSALDGVPELGVVGGLVGLQERRAMITIPDRNQQQQ